jgi:hypothetical protein
MIYHCVVLNECPLYQILILYLFLCPYFEFAAVMPVLLHLLCTGWSKFSY